MKSREDQLVGVWFPIIVLVLCVLGVFALKAVRVDDLPIAEQACNDSSDCDFRDHWTQYEEANL